MLPREATPPGAAVTDSQVLNLMALGAATGETTQAMTRHSWVPPQVDVLRDLLPQYEITALVARGGMGAIYRGWQGSLKRAVAIKVMPGAMEDSELRFTARFKQEAQAMAKLAHPHIVAVFDAGEVAGWLFFVMEFIEGTDVAQILADGEGMDPRQVVQILSAVCEALAFAHEEGIIHRDIKPSNIMLDTRGRVKVADFGLAKTLHPEAPLLTDEHVAIGTPDFMAPESLRPGAQVDGRADLYAVGVMLYQMLTGSIPRGRFKLPSQVMPQLSRAFDTLVDKAMQPHPDNRYQTAREMKAALEQAGLTNGVKQTMPARITSGKAKSSALRWGLGMGAAFFLAGPFVVMQRLPSGKASPTNPLQGNFPPPFSLRQWHELFTVEQEDVWQRLSAYENGRLHVKANVGFKKALPGTADGVVRAVVHIQSENENPTLFGRFRHGEGYYQALWDVKSGTVGLSYYGIGNPKVYEHLGARSLPAEVALQLGAVRRLELRLEGDRITALTDGVAKLEFRHAKLSSPGEWGIKSINGAWFESAEIQPIPAP